MKYRVEWLNRASSLLMEEAASASPEMQESIIAASVEVDKILEQQPMQVGESREWESTRVVFHSPLVVHYHVSERSRLVRVLSAVVVNKRN